MNCANHSDLPVSAYCQNCGKPMCSQCVRSVAGVVYCEPCLAAKMSSAGSPPYRPVSAAGSAGAAGAASYGPAAPGAAASGAADWASVPVAGPYPPGARRGGASPVVAGILGWIPGVGAMYNGQFVKAFAHVIVFVILIGVAQHFDAVGMLVAAWEFYQFFDAVQTAIARRDGRPLPDPFGLNDLGQRLGMPGAGYVPPAAPGYVPPAAGSAQPAGAYPFAGSAAASDPASQAFVNEAAAPPQPSYAPPPMPDPLSPEWEDWVQRSAAEKVMRDMGIPSSGPAYQPVSGIPGGPGVPAGFAPPPPAYAGGRSEPVGAIVLIAVGMLFLLSQLGVFRFDWIGHGWPVVIIIIGAGMLFKRIRSARRAGGGL